LSFTEAKYFSEGTTNVTDNNNITTRNYTIIPAKTVNETTITNTTSNIITQVRPVVVSDPPVSLPPKGGNSSPRKHKYQGVASGYIPTTSSYGTVDQNAGGYQPSTGSVKTQPAIGAAGVERALSTGYSIAEVQQWVTESGAVVGEEAYKKYGLKGVRNGY